MPHLHYRQHLQRSTSLPMLVPSPHFSSALIDRPPRPMFTCRRCGFSNFLLDMCLWCCWTSVEAKAQWAQSERFYYSTKSTHESSASSCRRSRRISAPPKVFWHHPITPNPYRRRSEPTTGTTTSLPPSSKSERSVSSTGCDDIETVAELRSGGVASPLPSLVPSTSGQPICVTKTATTSKQTADPPLHNGVMSSTKSVCLRHIALLRLRYVCRTYLYDFLTLSPCLPSSGSIAEGDSSCSAALHHAISCHIHM